MKNKYKYSQETLAFLGWACYIQNYTPEELNNLNSIETIMTTDDYLRWLEEESD